MFASHPKMAKRWALETSNYSKLPEHAGDAKVPGLEEDPTKNGFGKLMSMLRGR